MANDQELVIVEPFEVVAGRPLTADAVQPSAKVANYLLGALHTHAPMFSVSRDTPWFSFGGAEPASVLAAPIRLPRLSNRHTLMRAVVRCQVIGGAGATVKVEGLVSGDDASLLIAPGALADVDLGTLTMADVEDFDLVLDTDGVSTLQVYGLALHPEPLANPLPAETVEDASPIGIQRIDDDRTFAGAHNVMVHEATEIGIQRRRVLWSWVSANDLFGFGRMPDVLHVVPWMALLDSGESIHIEVNVNNFAGVAGNAYPIITTSADWPAPIDDFPIPIAADEVGWVSGDFDPPELDADRTEGFPQGWIGIFPGQGHPKTSPAVLSITVWTEAA